MAAKPYQTADSKPARPIHSGTKSSTNFGTPLCIIFFCGSACGTGPNSGDWWAWFGGIGAYEQGAVSQAVTYPNGSATLSFWLEAPFCTGNPADYLELNVDGAQEWVILATTFCVTS